ncbi:MAG: thioredoxin domain-containing protein [Thermoproteota archaeon]
MGYFIGNTIPITSNNVKQQSDIGIITSTVGQDDKSSTAKFAGSVNFEVPTIAKFRGSESAKLNLVEFGDYQCPFCEKFFKETEPILAKEYIDAGKVKFYFLDVSIVGPDSIILAQASWCADEQDKYYEYHDYMYANQGQENSGWGTPDKVKSLVKNIPGIDMEKFNECLDTKKYESRSQQLTQFANQLGLTGTPTMFVGNSDLGYTKITGAQPYSVFKQVIEKYLELV